MGMPQGMAMLSRVQKHDEAAFWLVASVANMAVDQPELTVGQLAKVLRKLLPRATEDYRKWLKAQDACLVGSEAPTAPSFGTGESARLK